MSHPKTSVQDPDIPMAVLLFCGFEKQTDQTIKKREKLMSLQDSGVPSINAISLGTSLLGREYH